MVSFISTEKCMSSKTIGMAGALYNHLLLYAINKDEHVNYTPRNVQMLRNMRTLFMFYFPLNIRHFLLPNDASNVFLQILHYHSV